MKITSKQVIRFVGWATLIATEAMIVMKISSFKSVSFFQIMSGSTSSSFCLYLGYSKEK